MCYISNQKGLKNFHNIKMDLKETGSVVGGGIMWFIIGTNGRLF
jgi:hypothetical protein